MDDAGCSTVEVPPQEGDVRLKPVIEDGIATDPCDDVHIGVVELYIQGRWGNICGGQIDVGVACRQLGYSFGSSVDLGSIRNEFQGFYDYFTPFRSELTWARDVRVIAPASCFGQAMVPVLALSCSTDAHALSNCL